MITLHQVYTRRNNTESGCHIDMRPRRSRLHIQLSGVQRVRSEEGGVLQKPPSYCKCYSMIE